MLVPDIATKNYTPTVYDLQSQGFDIFAPPFGSWWDTEVKTHKQELINKIIHTYYFNQICCDSPDRFRVYINAQLERIMPYYNQLYRSELIKINPLLTHKMVTNSKTYDKLVKLANSDRTNLGKALRDFANSGRTTNDQDIKGETESTLDNTMHHSSELAKEGQESTEKGRQEEESIGKTVKQTDNIHDDKTETKTTEFGKVVDKEGTGNETTNTAGTVNDNQTHTHSDTPQKAIGSDGHEYVRLDYLTDYKTDTDTTKTTTEGTKKTDYTDKSTDSGTEKVTTTNNNTQDATKDTKDDTDRDLTVTEKENTDWTETDTIEENKTEKGVNHGTNTEKLGQIGTEFKKGTESGLTSDYMTSKEERNENKETNDDTVEEGFSGISVSDLIKAFRETFLNIDDMIIKELRENFMEVF